MQRYAKALVGEVKGGIKNGVKVGMKNGIGSFNLYVCYAFLSWCVSRSFLGGRSMSSGINLYVWYAFLCWCVSPFSHQMKNRVSTAP